MDRESLLGRLDKQRITPGKDTRTDDTGGQKITDEKDGQTMDHLSEGWADQSSLQGTTVDRGILQGRKSGNISLQGRKIIQRIIAWKVKRTKDHC